MKKITTATHLPVHTLDIYMGEKRVLAGAFWQDLFANMEKRGLDIGEQLAAGKHAITKNGVQVGYFVEMIDGKLVSE